MKNRSRAEITVEILRSALEPSRKTVIMYKCSMEHPQLKEYLLFLLENQLLEFIRETKLYKTTPKGVSTMELLEHMNRLAGLYSLTAHHHHLQLSKSNAAVLLKGY